MYARYFSKVEAAKCQSRCFAWSMGFSEASRTCARAQNSTKECAAAETCGATRPGREFGGSFGKNFPTPLLACSACCGSDSLTYLKGKGGGICGALLEASISECAARAAGGLHIARARRGFVRRGVVLGGQCCALMLAKNGEAWSA